MYCQLEMCGWLGKLKKAEFGGHVTWSVLKCCHSAPDLQMWTSIPSQPVNFLDMIKVHSFFKCFTYWFVVQSLSHVQLFATPWTAACQASLSFAISQSSLKLMFIESVILQPSHPSAIPFSSFSQYFPSSGSFPVSWLFASGGQSIGALVAASVLPVNIQDWFPLGLTGLISCSPGNSQESSPAPQFKSINS